MNPPDTSPPDPQDPGWELVRYGPDGIPLAPATPWWRVLLLRLAWWFRRLARLRP